MKRFIYFLAGFVLFSTTAWAKHSNSNFDNSISTYWNFNQTQSFIFMDNGIEFSVFQDGQFDFFMPNYGPQINIGFEINNLNFSFNTGFNYSPFVQYDSFGLIIQIENTPIFYDAFGRVNQIGNVPVYYNNFGFVNRIGGLNIYYINNIYWRHRGFINSFNRAYVWRPWHRNYTIPSAQYCVVSPYAYRRYYTPVRHIYYRPYVNNSRHLVRNRSNPNYRANANNTGYAQLPRNRSERETRADVTRRNSEINRTRNSRIAESGSRDSSRRVATTRDPNRNLSRETKRSQGTYSNNNSTNEYRANTSASRNRNEATTSRRSTANETVSRNRNTTRNQSVTQSHSRPKSRDASTTSSRSRNSKKMEPRTSRSRVR
jgi:hypothetical protein